MTANAFVAAKSALLIVDLQNDFLHLEGAYARGGQSNDDLGALPAKVLPVAEAIRRAGGWVVSTQFTLVPGKNAEPFISPHLKQLRPFLQMGDLAQGSWGHAIHPELLPDENTVVLNPHKGLSNFWTGDAALNLRQNGIETIILYGMSANMCVESHARDAVENGFDVIIVADATAAAGDAAYESAITNYEFLAHEVVTTKQIIKRIEEAK